MSDGISFFFLALSYTKEETFVLFGISDDASPTLL